MENKEELVRLLVSRKGVIGIPDPENGVFKLIYKDGYVSSCPLSVVKEDYVSIGLFPSKVITEPASYLDLLVEAALLRHDVEDLGIYLRGGQIDLLEDKHYAQLLRMIYLNKTNLLDSLESMLKHVGVTPQCRHIEFASVPLDLVDSGREANEFPTQVIKYVDTIDIQQDGVQRTILTSRLKVGDVILVTRHGSVLLEKVTKLNVVMLPVNTLGQVFEDTDQEPGQ